MRELLGGRAISERNIAGLQVSGPTFPSVTDVCFVAGLSCARVRAEQRSMQGRLARLVLAAKLIRCPRIGRVVVRGLVSHCSHCPCLYFGGAWIADSFQERVSEGQPRPRAIVESGRRVRSRWIQTRSQFGLRSDGRKTVVTGGDSWAREGRNSL